MNNVAQKFFNALQQELGSIKAKSMPPIEEVQLQFLTTTKFWNLAKKTICEEPFADQQSEIKFFKYVKPMFIAEIDYYSLLYFQSIFQPHLFSPGYMRFLYLEQNRLPRFIRQHQCFFNYYSSGCTEKDIEYFTKTTSEHEEIDQGSVVDFYAECRGDALAARLLSLEKYNQFIKSKIETVLSGNFKVG